jgi:diguanylate cyclase (GGDEF)-like protein/PAS domain S-box-containing protein
MDAEIGHTTDPALSRILADLETLTNDAWIIVEVDGTIRGLNQRAAELHGGTACELVGASLATLRAPESLSTLKTDLQAACDGGTLYETVHVRSDGALFPVEISAKSTYVDGVCFIFAMIRDISERSALLEELLLKSALLDSTVDSIIVHTLDGRPIYMNASAYRALRIEGADLSGSEPYFWIGPRFRVLGPSRNEAILAQGHHTFEGEAQRVDGTTFPTEVTGSTLELPSGIVIMSVIRDVTDRMHAEEAVRHLAYHDPLTGLANRTQMRDQLALAVVSARRHGDVLGVAYLDLDGFKPINDTLGHAMGDKALALIADRLRANVRAGDTVARLGGDEFAVVLPRIADSGDLEYAAKKLYDAIAEPMAIDGHALTVTASIGLALFDQDEDDIDSLLIKADLAMYSGRRESSCGWAVYRDGMQVDALSGGTGQHGGDA